MSADSTIPQRRRMARVPFRVPCRVSWGADRNMGETIDVGLGGVLAELQGTLPAVGQRCFVEIDLGHGAGSVEVLATGVHVNDDRIGLSFESLGVEALSHLRQIVRLNAADELDACSELRAFLERSRSASRNPNTEGAPS